MTVDATWDRRRTFEPVRRNSYDVDDPRAQVFRPIAGGEKTNALNFVDNFIRMMKRWALHTKKPGKPHEISLNAIHVADVLLRRCTDFKTGRCEPCLDTLRKLTGFARPTLVRALAMLRAHGFLDWVRRTVRTGIPRGEGPQVKQTSNAYFFDLSRLPAECLAALRQLLRKGVPIDDLPRRRPRSPLRGRTRRQYRDELADRLSSATTLEAKAAALYPNSPDDQRAWLDMHREGASSETGRNPSSSMKGEAE